MAGINFKFDGKRSYMYYYSLVKFAAITKQFLCESVQCAILRKDERISIELIPLTTLGIKICILHKVHLFIN